MVKLNIMGSFKHAGDCQLSKYVKISQKIDEQNRDANFRTHFFWQTFL
jgi:hypothetical protein